MATANLESKLVVTDPDFDVIKTNLKEFLRSQETFTDYDFEGSGLAALVDLLAYNTHYMAFYANMIANESFLDTASIRDSVVSHAKMLGYTPHSTTSATARINLSFSDTSAETSLTLPRFTKFASSGLDGVNYIFTNLEEHTVNKVSNSFKFVNLDLKEGTPVNYVYTYNQLTNPQAEFVINDSNVDTSTIQVIIQQSVTNQSQTTYFPAEDATIVDEESTVYYIDETKDKKYKIYFGNGIVGKSLTDGNIVILSYLISKGSAANKANTLSLIDTVRTPEGTALTGVVTTLLAGAGGAEAETIQSIKFTAPKSFVSNNRAVTKNDYISLIKKNYPSLEAVNVWGGEENVPPVYGKVFISAKPALGYEITLTEKDYIIKNVIEPLSILTVTPEFVDPDYTFLNLNVKVTYDPTATVKTPGEIATTAKSAVYNFANKNLNSFNSYFKLSRLMRDIDNSDTSILSNQVDVTLEKRLEPVVGTSRNYTVDFHTALKRSTGKYRITSSPAFFAYDSDDNYRSFFFEEEPLSFTGIYSVKVLYGGTGFTYTPTLEVYGDGFGAELSPVITNGKITAVNVTKTGSEYSTAQIFAYDQDGNKIEGLIFEAVIENKVGRLRTYYLDDNKIKTIYSTEAGTIDYSTGTLVLKNFSPVDVNSDLKVLKFFATPENPLFTSDKNSIITLDVEDTASVTVTPIQAN